MATLNPNTNDDRARRAILAERRNTERAMTDTPQSTDTKPDSETVERYRKLLMEHHSDDMTMEQVSSLAHEAARTEQFARKISHCTNDSCTTCPANALQIAYYVQERETAARLDELLNVGWHEDGILAGERGIFLQERIAELEGSSDGKS